MPKIRIQHFSNCPYIFGVKSKNMLTTPTISTINIQDYLRQPLKIVRGCKDYREEEELLRSEG
jgi:hypothetical protein